jgi:hypothetical protein
MLLGSTLWPMWSPHRRATCAGDLPNFSAIILRIGFLRTSILIFCEPAEPNGAYP